MDILQWLVGFWRNQSGGDGTPDGKQAKVVSETAQRLARFQKAWDAYYGRWPAPLSKRGKLDDSVTVNLARVLVDKGVDFLFGGDVGFELAEENARAAEWLSECWAANRKMTTLQMLAINGGVCGHGFVKIVQGATSTAPYPRLVVLDPGIVEVTWSPDDIAEVTEYRIMYPVREVNGETVIRRQVIRPGNGGTYWEIRDEQKAVKGGEWQTLSTQNWPYPFPPIVHTQNLPAPNEFWGTADLEADVLQLNAALNFVLSNMARIIRYHAHPKTWGKGFSASQLTIGVDETIVLPSEKAELHNLEMSGDLGSSLALAREIKQALHEIARVPEIAVGKVENIGALSGVALRVLYEPLLDKTETKRLLYGDMLTELNRRLLAIGGFGDSMRVKLHWPELLPKDMLETRQAAVIDQQLGVSQDTLLRRLGYDPEQEAEKRKNEAATVGAALLTAFDRGV